MKLYSQYPYWLMKNGLISSYKSLPADTWADVAIIGGGISGALTAHQLAAAGMRVAILDRRHAGCGSTAASTSFLQYEIDEPLVKLKEKAGPGRALRAYELCRDAIYQISDICAGVKGGADFSLRPSMQYASYKKHLPTLAAEYALRLKHGFKVKWLEESDLQKKYGINAPGGIFSEDGGELDAFALTHALLSRLHRDGHGVYNNTEIKEISHKGRKIALHTANGQKVTAGAVVVACGYESQKYLPRQVADIHTTYALVSEPIAPAPQWYKDSLVWETARPYLYFRKVDGNKILAGGRDDPFHRPHYRESIIKQKTKMLEAAIARRAGICMRADYSWAGAFAVTKDGLPYIGSLPGQPNVHFALGFGGNGITFSAIAATIICDTITGKKNSDAALFGFDR